jgi:hypothetical protein
MMTYDSPTDTQKNKVKNMNQEQEYEPTVCMTEREAVEQLARRRYKTRQERGFARPEPQPCIRFKNAEGHEMVAWRSKHAVHVRRVGTSVRGTSTYHLPKTRTADVPKTSPFAGWTVGDLKDECGRLGLKKSGRKNEIIRRLNAHLRGEEE